MLYNTIIQVIAGLVNVIGTTYAVLSILKASPSDLYRSITLQGMGNNDTTLLIQRNQARIGIGLVALAWIVQTVFSFVQITSFCFFLICISICLIITALLLITLHFVNKKFSDDYYQSKNEFEDKSTEVHTTLHEWNEL